MKKLGSSETVIKNEPQNQLYGQEGVRNDIKHYLLYLSEYTCSSISASTAVTAAAKPKVRELLNTGSNFLINKLKILLQGEEYFDEESNSKKPRYTIREEIKKIVAQGIKNGF